MSDIKLNVSYRGLSRQLSELTYGIRKMTDGYLNEIAEVGKERLEQAYGEEYDASFDYDGIKPRLSAKKRKTRSGYYKLTVEGENAALLEYGTGELSEWYEGDLPSGWAQHTPAEPNKNSGRKDRWYFKVPSGLADNSAWSHVWYRKKIKAPEGDPEYKMIRGQNELVGEWADYEALMETHAGGYEVVPNPAWGVAYGHEPANGIPKARDAMLKQAEESAKKFYLRKYK